VACCLRLDAEDCAVVHWCEEFRGHREPNGQWRADCPYPECGAKRALEWDAPGKSVRWKSFCTEHDKDALRPVLADRLKGCLPRRQSDRAAISHDDLAELALSGLPPMTMKLMMLRLTGMGTQEALGKLGVRTDNRARVIGGRTGSASKRTRNRRS
jgi:hypothetical protein